MARDDLFATPAESKPQTPAAPDSESSVATFRVNARSVVVDVVVTDKRGKAVTGIPRQNFQVFEDGKPQAVTFFEEHAGAATTARLPNRHRFRPALSPTFRGRFRPIQSMSSSWMR